ncbi:MAG: ABC transporter ATP-binding protein, partial [Lentisphaerae bacterium]|nr:ABC transporter ATP-binding protein [Lentisphaerota bacterium]
STHILEEVDAVCSRAIIINKGVIVANATPAELRARSRSCGAVELTFARPAADAAAGLKALHAASNVEWDGNRAVIFPRDSAALPAEVLALIKQKQAWPVTGMKVLEGRLDEVFQQLTLGQASAA